MRRMEEKKSTKGPNMKRQEGRKERGGTHSHRQIKNENTRRPLMILINAELDRLIRNQLNVYHNSR